VLVPFLSTVSRSDRVRRFVSRASATRRVVDRFVAGNSAVDALDASMRLVRTGRLVTIDFLGEDTRDEGVATTIRDEYLTLLGKLADQGLASRVEVSLKLSALGQQLPDGARISLNNARLICEAAHGAGTTVTLDMEDHTTVDATLDTLSALRADFPWVGAVLQSCLRRTDGDCRDLAYAGSRVRLVKGAYAEPPTVAHESKSDVDAAFIRCLEILMAGTGYPMIATHNPRLIYETARLATLHGRSHDTFEYQMLYGARTTEQQRLAEHARLRVYVPYGNDWYGYFMRRLAERPANVSFFLRALVSR
jgi:proline dehydrogenase